jgi:ribosomal-protein-alanine N-acetyltransferase
MSEAVGGMIEWAKKVPNISFIKASTDKVNAASFLVLEKNHFSKVGETETMFDWRLKIK